MFAVRVIVDFSEPEVDDIDVVFGAFSASNQEVVGLYIAVNDSLLVYFLNALDLNENSNEMNLNLPSRVQCGRPSSGRTCGGTPGKDPRDSCQEGP